MRIAFLGTFAVPSLDALAGAGHEVACVVCQPDRPAGRCQARREPATKYWARQRGLLGRSGNGQERVDEKARLPLVLDHEFLDFEARVLDQAT